MDRHHRLGIVDLGSNTARLVVYELERGAWFRLTDQIREPVRLGEGLATTGRLSDAGMERTEAAVKLFADYAANTEVPQLEVLGTSAMRDASNSREFLERIEPYGLPLRVLSGSSEAELGALAVANSFDFQDAWVVDLGGGSAQVSLMAARRFATGGAHPLGAVRLTEAFLRSDPPTREEVADFERHLEATLGEQAELMAGHDAPLVAMGGTVRNLARAAQIWDAYPLAGLLHGYYFRLDSLESLTEHLLGQRLARRKKVPGISAYRADIVVAGALTFRWLLRRAQRDGLWISGYGLREGELFRHFLDSPHVLPDVRAFSVRNLLAHYARGERHRKIVRRLASRLFEGLKPLHGLGDREASVLAAGAELEGIGLAVNYYRHDRHGAYLVSSAQLSGFSHREQALIARLVRFHLKGSPGLGRLRACCRPGDDHLLAILVACLRTAEHLDRPRAGRVRDVEVVLAEKTVRIRLDATEDPSLELYGVEQPAELLGNLFERRFEFEVRPA